MGGISASGPLPPDVLAPVVRMAFPLYRACYDDALRDFASQGGRIYSWIEIGLDGRVTHVRSSADIPDLRMVDCIGAVLANLEFPAPEVRPQRLAVPLAFDPR
jgi:hypothetical protein